MTLGVPLSFQSSSPEGTSTHTAAGLTGQSPGVVRTHRVVDGLVVPHGDPLGPATGTGAVRPQAPEGPPPVTSHVDTDAPTRTPRTGVGTRGDDTVVVRGVGAQRPGA